LWLRGCVSLPMKCKCNEPATSPLQLSKVFPHQEKGRRGVLPNGKAPPAVTHSQAG
jgi:hypothetical protein